MLTGLRPRSKAELTRCAKHWCWLPQAVYNADHDVKIVRAAMQKQSDTTAVNLPEFQKRVKQGFPAFGLLHRVAKGR